MRYQLPVTTLMLRLALAATMLSAVASRLGFLGNASSGWKGFLAYTAEVNSFAPANIIPFLAVCSTVLETGFSLLLITGYKTRWAASGTAILTLIFALCMTWSFGIKSPLDYSVFADSAGAFLLSATGEYKWSLDDWLAKRSANLNPQTI